MPLTKWRQLGVRLPGGKPLPKSAIEASLVSGDRRHFLVYHNYDALLEYNCAHSYAISVALLGDAVAATPPRATPKKSAEQQP
jgi:membrane-bound lytic murein transglycosylase B